MFKIYYFIWLKWLIWPKIPFLGFEKGDEGRVVWENQIAKDRSNKWCGWAFSKLDEESKFWGVKSCHLRMTSYSIEPRGP